MQTSTSKEHTTVAKKKSRSKAKAKAKTKLKTKSKTKAKSGLKAKKSVRTPAKIRAKAKAMPKTNKPKIAKPKMAAPAVSIAQTLPNIEVETTGGGRLRLSGLKGKNVVLYFYPKDDTPGCTTEGCDIRDRYPEFQRRDTVVLGVSRDGLESHEKFKAKFGFPFELVTDPNEKLCRSFDVIRKKSLYGKEYMGVDRSTFIFDKEGKLRKEFRGVQVTGHTDEILNELNKL